LLGERSGIGSGDKITAFRIGCTGEEGEDGGGGMHGALGVGVKGLDIRAHRGMNPNLSLQATKDESHREIAEEQKDRQRHRDRQTN
jgi:hypothetical protein